MTARAHSSRSERSDGPLPRTATGAELDLRLRSHKQAVYEKLQEMIITLDLPPGERLIETELASRFGVSKTPVREAFSLLEADGLAEITPYRGASVTWLSVNQMHEQGFLVDALEMPAYPLVVERITDDELAAIGLAVQDLKQARREGDGLRYGQIAAGIHSLIFAPTKYPRLLQMIRMTIGPIGRRFDMAFSFPFEESWDLHMAQALARCDAIAQRDASLAIRVVREYRERMSVINLARASQPEFAKYFKAD